MFGVPKLTRRSSPVEYVGLDFREHINDPVVISNLPLGSSMSVPENTAEGTLVYVVSYSDDDVLQTRTFTMTSSPGIGLAYFSINSTSGEIRTTATTLNYETIETLNFTLSVTVSDSVMSDTQPLDIDVTNVNEGPSFSQSAYRISSNEGSAGDTVGSPTYGVADPDTDDAWTFTLDCGADTGYFSINSSTGSVSFQSDYDLDSDLLSAEVECSVTVTDNGGLTASADLDINILDTNDNSPIFTPGSYSFFVSYYAVAGTVVDTVTASDADSGAYGTLTFSLDQSTLLVEYFSISNAGVISVKTSVSGLGWAIPVSVTAIATDSGGLADSAPVTIIISDTTTTSTTTTTDSYMTFFHDRNNMAWFVVACVLLLFAAAVFAWMAYTCRGENGCTAVMRKWLVTHGDGTTPMYPI